MKYRLIAVRPETYTQLWKLRGRRIAEKKGNITFDEIIRELLQKAEQKAEGEE